MIAQNDLKGTGKKSVDKYLVLLYPNKVLFFDMGMNWFRLGRRRNGCVTPGVCNRTTKQTTISANEAPLALAA